MTSDYRKGLEKLGVIQNDQQTVDLRSNPAFAWKVLCASANPALWKAHGRWCCDLSDKYTSHGDTAGDALYAAVEQLGAEHL